MIRPFVKLLLENESSPPADVVNFRRAPEVNLPARRSPTGMLKMGEMTTSPMLPDDKAFETVQLLFRNLTPTEPIVGGPIVKPLMVIVTVADGGMAAPDVVITTAVAEVAPHFAVKPATLLAPEATVGVTDEANQLEGCTSVKMLPDRIEED